MRLLEYISTGRVSFAKNVDDNNLPAYGILSHTWGEDGNCVTFQDLANSTRSDKSGYEKIHFCGEQAGRNGLRYFWLDTCCIDKSSCAELAEAINSTFSWYRESARYYVYLSDISSKQYDNTDPSSHSCQSTFAQIRWFTRG